MMRPSPEMIADDAAARYVRAVFQGTGAPAETVIAEFEKYREWVLSKVRR